MNKITLNLLLIGHLLGDFYFQSNNKIYKKEKKFDKLFLHCIIYFFSMLFAMLPIFSINILSWVILINFIHFLIEWTKVYLYENYKLSDNNKTLIFFVDQSLHIITIIFVYLLIFMNPLTTGYSRLFMNIVEIFDLNTEIIVSWMLAVLLVIRPFSIFIEKSLYKYQPLTVAKEELGHPGAGSLIGILERLIILVMLSQNQFAAIGFVLTAKSIARYNKIIEDSQFSEYYLLGTLLSMFLVLITYIMLFS